VPGEFELQRYHDGLRDGVTVDEDVLARLSELAGVTP
jgi:LDH2 family malate/lactate/ureidoglycolate dehydrogenase